MSAGGRGGKGERFSPSSAGSLGEPSLAALCLAKADGHAPWSWSDMLGEGVGWGVERGAAENTGRRRGQQQARRLLAPPRFGPAAAAAAWTTGSCAARPRRRRRQRPLQPVRDKHSSRWSARALAMLLCEGPVLTVRASWTIIAGRARPLGAPRGGQLGRRLARQHGLDDLQPQAAGQDAPDRRRRQVRSALGLCARVWSALLADRLSALRRSSCSIWLVSSTLLAPGALGQHVPAGLPT